MDDLDSRRARAAQNQSLFREVNERIAALSQRYDAAFEPNGYLCECLNTSCGETLQLEHDEYERLRASGTRFFVLPGHEDLAVEDVVEETDAYLVVEKIGVGSEIAAAMDPRKAVTS